MARNEQAQRNHDELFPGHVSTVAVTDPELIEIFDNFAFDEVLRHGNLDIRTRLMVQLASIMACQAVRGYRAMLGAALTVGVTPVEAKEILYQAVPYLGIARTFDFIQATNEVLTERGIKLPDAGLVYWKSQLRARREAAARAAEPIAFVERFALVCAALTILGVSIWRWHAIRLWLASLAGGWSWPANAGAPQTFFSGLWAKPGSLVVICAIGLLVFLTGVVCLIWNEEKRVTHHR